MSIFDDDLIGKLKQEAMLKEQEAELLKQEERKKMLDALKLEKAVGAYLTDCLLEFSAAAKKVNVQTEPIQLGIKHTKRRKTIKVWKVAESTKNGSVYYITDDSSCFEKSYHPDIFPPGSLYEYVSELSFERMVHKLCSNCDWCGEGEEKIKEHFIEVLSGKYT